MAVKGRNVVIDGEYISKKIGDSFGLFINVGFIKTISLNSDTVESYEIKDEQPINDVYVVLIKFKDGKKSLIEMDGKHFMTFKRTFMYKIDQ